MNGLPYKQLERDTPESIVDNYLQQGLQDIQQRFESQWNEVNSRAKTLGQRKQMEMLNELQSKATQEIMTFRQQTQQQMQQLQLVDRLAQQNSSINANEVKMRMVLGPETETAMFPKPTPEKRPPSVSELRSYESWLERKAPDFMTIPSKEIKKWYLPRRYEKLTGPTRMVYDPDIEPVYDEKKKTWTKGGYRPATQEDIQEKMYYDTELKKVREELRNQPDIAVRVRSAMLKTKRDPEHTSFDTKVQQSKPELKALSAPREQKVIRQRNTRTGQTRISYDGGITWQMSG